MVVKCCESGSCRASCEGVVKGLCKTCAGVVQGLPIGGCTKVFQWVGSSDGFAKGIMYFLLFSVCL